MILIVAATEFETKPLEKVVAARDDVELLIAGVGPVATAMSLAVALGQRRDIALLVNIGVAGAYLDGGANLLDVCLAEQEVLGDFGICLEEKIEDFAGNMDVAKVFPLPAASKQRVEEILRDQQVAYVQGNFVTVNGASATEKRGKMLRDQYNGLCENMEGAAVAMVAAEFNLPLVEIRTISNMVEDRDRDRWQLDEAISRCAEVVSLVLERLC